MEYPNPPPTAFAVARANVLRIVVEDSNIPLTLGVDESYSLVVDKSMRSALKTNFCSFCAYVQNSLGCCVYLSSASANTSSFMDLKLFHNCVNGMERCTSFKKHQSQLKILLSFLGEVSLFKQKHLIFRIIDRHLSAFSLYDKHQEYYRFVGHEQDECATLALSRRRILSHWD